MTRARTLDTGILYCDDNRDRLSTLPSESVDMIYLDPPFFSNRHYEVIWGDEAEVRSFNDRWDAGIWQYIDWMKHRIIEMHRVLKPTGSLFLHCDHHASHYLKVLLDDIFGAKGFRNEIVWHYSGWNKRMTRHFEHRHDVILFYAKSHATAAGKQKFLSYTTPWESKEQYLKVRKQKLHRDPDGTEYVLSDAGGGKRVKRYLDEAMQYGRPVDDVWDIDKINNSSGEAEGYPTQKPMALLERIIATSTEPGDVVLDPFCGCGTTVAVAEQMGRRWVGIDISPTAVRLMVRRLDRSTRHRCKPTVVGLPTTIDELRALKPFEFQNWVIDRVVGTAATRKSGDMGIDGYSYMTHDPIQVKQSDGVGRNVVDNFETAIRRNGSDKGYIVAFSFGTGAKREAARARVNDGIDITLVTVQDLLDEARQTGPLWPKGASVTQLRLDVDDAEDEAPLDVPAKKNLPSFAELVESSRRAETA